MPNAEFPFKTNRLMKRVVNKKGHLKKDFLLLLGNKKT